MIKTGQNKMTVDPYYIGFFLFRLEKCNMLAKLDIFKKWSGIQVKTLTNHQTTVFS